MVKKRIKITEDANIAKLIEKYPVVSEVLFSFGMHCVGCFANRFDTIKEGAMVHGMDEEEIKEIINEINKIINNPELLNE